MDYTRTSSHPLDISSFYISRVALRVLVFKCPIYHVCDCLKTTMRMVRGSLCFTCGHYHWSHFIQQKKRIKLPQPMIWKRPVDKKSFSLKCSFGITHLRH